MEPVASATMLLHCAREYTWEQGAWRWEGMNRTEYVNKYILMKGKGDEMACGSQGKGGIRGSSSCGKNGGEVSNFNELNELLGEVESLKKQLSFERRAREKAELALKSRSGASSDLMDNGDVSDVSQDNHADALDAAVPAAPTFKR